MQTGSGRPPAETIAALLAGRGTEETRRLLFDGVAFVARHVAGREGPGLGSADDAPEIWRRVPVAPGIELHVRADVPKLRREEAEIVLARVEAALGKNIRP